MGEAAPVMPSPENDPSLNDVPENQVPERKPSKVAVVIAMAAVAIAILIVMLAPGSGTDSSAPPAAGSASGNLKGSPNTAEEDAAADAKASGKSAPLNFTLKDMNGVDVKLASFKGKPIVMNFWATWCGPCLAAMPQVERAARDFADQGVQLIAVNLEEAPKQIKSMLERHKLDLTVALDRDGAVAEKYKASAIPQTVIIDKEGNVVRVFIGGGPNFDDQVRDALRPLFPDAKPVQ